MEQIERAESGKYTEFEIKYKGSKKKVKEAVKGNDYIRKRPL